ncbi:hypothetical protein L3Q82_007895 [Scortum barcoo]|uniref:Uncharacterized protein n=1 Tax=Scortum barcoo TaxID=214431 RepID=A0ACB8WK14_9TELE|nr:hypothetical protein L3Q82_007895 [Scortum barcoo]
MNEGAVRLKNFICGHRGATVMAVDILHALEDLTDDDFKEFKWYLQQCDILEGYQKFKVSKLEKAKRHDIVSLMMNGWKLDGALKVTKKVLCNMNRTDLVESLPDTNSGTEGAVNASWFLLRLL